MRFDFSESTAAIIDGDEGGDDHKELLRTVDDLILRGLGKSVVSSDPDLVKAFTKLVKARAEFSATQSKTKAKQLKDELSEKREGTKRWRLVDRSERKLPNLIETGAPFAPPV